MTQEQIMASPVCQKQIIESQVCQTFFDCHPRHPSSAASECHGEVALCCAAGESCQQLALQGKEWHSSYIFYILHHMNRQNMSSTPGDRIRRCCWSKLKKDQLPCGTSDGFESVSHSTLRTRCRTPPAGFFEARPSSDRPPLRILQPFFLRQAALTTVDNGGRSHVKKI
jgi:hypothetical protein